MDRDPVSFVVGKLRGFAKSSQDFAAGILHGRDSQNRRRPIEILKRLQREAFSDLMKLRDRQDKVERMISLYKYSKGSPFQETSTHVRGEVDILGTILMARDDQQSCDAITMAGIRSGINSKFSFQSSVREKDSFVAEFVASGNSKGNVLVSPLSLAKVLYAANVSDWCSAVAIPVGAQCKDFAIATNSSHQGKGLTDYSCFMPPLLHQLNGSAIGLAVRRLNVTASLAQFISRLGSHSGSTGIVHRFGTFGQVVCQLSSTTKFSLLGIHRVHKLSSQQVDFGAMTLPIGALKRGEVPVESTLEGSGSSIQTDKDINLCPGSIALILESELDENNKIGGWVEMKNSNGRCLQWAVSMVDSPDDGFSWGLSLGGLVRGPTNWDHFQVETNMKFNIGRKFSLQPALLYVMDGTVQFPALMFRSSWSL